MGRDERLKRREAATAAIVAGPHGWISRRMLRGAAPSEWRKPYRIILGAGGIALQAAPGIWPDSAARTTPMPDDPLARAFRALRSCGVPVAEGSCRYSADGTAIEYDFLPD